ncbi:MAG: replication initiator [Frankia sp.]
MTTTDRPGDLGDVGGVVPAVCARPVRLAGHVDEVDVASGEMRRVLDSAGLPGGVVHAQCRNRRETACPACSALYKRDARTLVLGGLVGGRNVPASVGGHPALFTTLTAPSFGPVHSRRLRPGGGPARACRPRRGLCPHGRPAGCHARHGAEDVRLGEPICPDCFDYPGAVVWNALASRLWAVTRRAIVRNIAGAAGVSVSRLRGLVRVASVRVVEMQARGLVHIHAVIRLDGPGGPGDPPPGWADGDLLVGAVRAAVAESAVTCPPLTDGRQQLGGQRERLGGVVRWGAQLDVAPVRRDAVEKVGNYLAKYLTKSVDGGGRLDRPVRSVKQLYRLGLPPHPHRLALTAWRIGHDPVAGPAIDRAAGRIVTPATRWGVARWAHTYGYGGHWVSKTQTYSTTFTTLRNERATWARTARLGENPADSWGRPAGDERTVTVADWRYVGRGHDPDGTR